MIFASEERIRKGIQKLIKCKNTQTQGRLDGFFKVLPKENNGSSAVKRKADSAKPAPKKKSSTARKPR